MIFLFIVFRKRKKIRSRFVRRQPVVDPILVWWRSRGPVTVLRLPDTAEVVRHHVGEEDEHVYRWLC